MKAMPHTQPRPDDERLIRNAQAGDPAALDGLFARYSRALYPTALRLMGNPEDAEDALQDGLLSAYRNFGRFEGRSQFSTWLTRIVINAALMRLRSQRARPTTSLDQEDPQQPEVSLATRLADERPGPEDICAGREQFEIFERELQALPQTLQTVVWLRDVQGLSTEETAEMLGVSQGTLKSQLHRARLKLAELIRSARPSLSLRLRGAGRPAPAGA